MYAVGMSKLDVARERISYIRFWIGVMVASDIGLMSWLLTGFESAPVRKLWAAIVAVILISCIVFQAHRRIERRINRLEEL